MREIGGLLFIAVIVALFLASMAFGALATIATLILLGIESAWAYAKGAVAARNLLAIAAAFVPPAAFVAGVIWLARG